MQIYRTIPRFIISVILLLLTFWSLWALLFGMTISAMLGIMAVPFLLQSWLPKPFPKRTLVIAALFLPNIIWYVGWTEYRRQSVRFNCSAYQIFYTIRSDIPSWCPSKYRAPICTKIVHLLVLQSIIM